MPLHGSPRLHFESLGFSVLLHNWTRSPERGSAWGWQSRHRWCSQLPGLDFPLTQPQLLAISGKRGRLQCLPRRRKELILLAWDSASNPPAPFHKPPLYSMFRSQNDDENLVIICIALINGARAPLLDTWPQSSSCQDCYFYRVIACLSTALRRPRR